MWTGHDIEVPLLAPGAGEVVVEMAGGSFNPIDLKSREGRGAAPVLGSLPISIGWDVAGVVVAIGDGVAQHAVGDPVLGMPCFPASAGAYSTHGCAPADQLVRWPRTELSAESAGVLPLASLTALSAVRDLGGVGEGHVVLVHGAAGGVGHLAVQVARALGAHVVAHASRESASFVSVLGADEVVVRGEQDVSSVLRERRVDVVVDLVGDVEVAGLLGLVRRRGTYVCAPGGAAVGLKEAAEERGVLVRQPSVRPDAEGLKQLVSWVVEGRLVPRAQEVFELGDIADAHRRLERRRAREDCAHDARLPRPLSLKSR